MPEEVANQSQEQAAPETATNEQPAGASTTQEQPKGITVKYNKEDRFIPEEEAPTWIQKGLNYDKVSERAKEAEKYQQNLDRIAKFYGFDSHDKYMDALNEAEQQRQIEEEARRLGVDEQVVLQHLKPLQDKVAGFEQEQRRLEQERASLEVEKDLTTLRAKYPDWDKYQDATFELAIQQGYRLEDAYRLASYEDKMSSAAQKAEAETVRKLQENAQASTGSAAAGAEHNGKFETLSKADKLRMIEEVKQGKRTSFD
ncbi:hypothetical protein [Gorillibacterium timonense]|uniref:hypothetical protein n=1 Tax=Gorillibacterium timonense TaxID=1689269 RepID=UPI00071C4C47|nr:hypothetical protein [Gorillibacterium timonense]